PGGQSSGARSASSPLPQGKQESPGFSRESTSIPHPLPSRDTAQRAKRVHVSFEEGFLAAGGEDASLHFIPTGEA
ncbi:hypothetical protein, partial [Streptomyces sp. NPDC054765]